MHLFNSPVTQNKIHDGIFSILASLASLFTFFSKIRFHSIGFQTFQNKKITMVNENDSEHSNDFEFSLSEIESQLHQMGIVDVSQGALKQFQHDLQHLVGTNDTQNTENTQHTQNTENTRNTAESYLTANTGTNNNRNNNNILDNSDLTLTQDFDDNDDAVSIISTTNEMNQSFASGISNRSRKRKTVRQGVVTSKTYDTTQS